MKRVKTGQCLMHRSPPTTLAGAAAVLAYVASFWIDGDDSSEKGFPVYECLTHDEMLNAGEGFLPMLAEALQQLTAARAMRGLSRQGSSPHRRQLLQENAAVSDSLSTLSPLAAAQG